MDKTRLAGRKALITGGAQGMGAAIAKHWAAQGAAVCVADLYVEGVEKVAEEIKAAGGKFPLVLSEINPQQIQSVRPVGCYR